MFERLFNKDGEKINLVFTEATANDGRSFDPDAVVKFYFRGEQNKAKRLNDAIQKALNEYGE